MLARFENVEPCLIGMEFCGSSQYWARQLQDLGHTVRLMDGKLVKPFVSHNKSDKADAEGIHAALMQRVRAVAVKGNAERDIQTLLSERSRLVDERTGDINHMRGLLYEYGCIMPVSASKFEALVGQAIQSLEGKVAAPVVDSFRDRVEEIRSAGEKIKKLTDSIKALAHECKNAGHLQTVPGVGVVTMAYMCVLLADPSVYGSARQFAAYLGLVPMHTGSGGKTINTHIPGRCDKRLRALLVECAQAVARSKHPSVWVKHILDTKPKKVALIAIANRIARQCWAVASKSEDYRDMSAVPAA